MAPVFGLLSAVLAGASLRAEPQEVPFARARALMRACTRSGEVAGMVVAVTRGDRIVWAQGFGWADREAHRLATPDTPFALASLTKMFTATALLQDVEAGRVDLDAPINRYLSGAGLQGLAAPAKGATVRRVANHTSGLAPMEHFFYGAKEIARIPPMDLSIARYGLIAQEPGTAFRYNNFGYGLLGHVLERLAGRPYARIMRARVFEPLGMEHASIGLDPRFPRLAARRYGLDGKPIPPQGVVGPGASEMFASARDLSRFARVWLGHGKARQNAALSPASRRAMVSHMVREGPGIEYGLALERTTIAGTLSIEHTGSMSGVNTWLTMLPEQDMAIILLANSATDLKPVRNAILEEILPGAPSLATQAVALPVESGGSEAARAPAGTWHGTLRSFAQDLPLALQIAADGSARVKLGDQPWSVLEEARWTKGTLTGHASSQIRNEDTRAHPHRTRWRLQLKEGRLHGIVLAFTAMPGTPGAVSPYWHYALPYWAQLERP